MKVVDASVAVKWFAQEQGREAAMSLIRSEEPLAAPDLVVVEVLNVLRRKHRLKSLDKQQVIEAADTIAACFSELVPSASLVRDAARLSIVLDHSVYDCAYLVCSSLLDAPLITADQVFAEKARAKSPNVQILLLNAP